MNYKGTLVIARHGHYGPNNRLNDRGKKQIENLSAVLNSDKTNGLISGKIIILSSTAPRAKDSAEILFKELYGKHDSVELEYADILWSGNDSPKKMDTTQVLQLIQEKADEQADVIIVVTHLEYVTSLPSKIGLIGYKNLNKGEMLVVDMATEKHSFYSGD